MLDPLPVPPGREVPSDLPGGHGAPIHPQPLGKLPLGKAECPAREPKPIWQRKAEGCRWVAEKGVDSRKVAPARSPMVQLPVAE